MKQAKWVSDKAKGAKDWTIAKIALHPKLLRKLENYSLVMSVLAGPGYVAYIAINKFVPKGNSHNLLQRLLATLNSQTRRLGVTISQNALSYYNLAVFALSTAFALAVYYGAKKGSATISTKRLELSEQKFAPIKDLNEVADFHAIKDSKQQGFDNAEAFDRTEVGAKAVHCKDVMLTSIIPNEQTFLAVKDAFKAHKSLINDQPSKAIEKLFFSGKYGDFTKTIEELTNNQTTLDQLDLLRALFNKTIGQKQHLAASYALL